MLGKAIHDPGGIESDMGSALGLGLLDAVTTFAKEKSTTQVKARVAANWGLLKEMAGQELIGYEIHMGQTENMGDRSAFHIFETPEGNADYADGTISAQGTVLGTYIHGLFHNHGFRRSLLNSLRRRRGLPERWGETVTDKENQYDRLAQLIRQSLDMERIYQIIDQGIN